MRLKILQPFVEVGAIGPDVGLCLGVGLADIGDVGESLARKVRKEGDALGALRRVGLVIGRGPLGDGAKLTEVVSDQGIRRLARLDGLFCRRRAGASSPRGGSRGRGRRGALRIGGQDNSRAQGESRSCRGDGAKAG